MSEISPKSYVSAMDEWVEAQHPLAYNHDCVWYELGGKPLETLHIFRELADMGHKATEEEKENLRKNLGLDFYVVRNTVAFDENAPKPSDKWDAYLEAWGDYLDSVGIPFYMDTEHTETLLNDQQSRLMAHRPTVFQSPFPDDDGYYLMCPVGSKGENKRTHFIPQDSKELTQEEEDNLTKILFMAWGGSMPLIPNNPLLVGEQENTEPPKHSNFLEPS